jgi:hypothetical protein
MKILKNITEKGEKEKMIGRKPGELEREKMYFLWLAIYAVRSW